MRSAPSVASCAPASLRPTVIRQEVTELARLRFLDQHANVCLLGLGPPGVEKSHLTVALGYQAVLAGRAMRFTMAQDLVDLYAPQADGGLRTRMRALSKLALLIIDELAFLAWTPRRRRRSPPPCSIGYCTLSAEGTFATLRPRRGTPASSLTAGF